MPDAIAILMLVNYMLMPGRYTTQFPLVEYPISEGTRWQHAANAWQHVQTANGLAFAGAPNAGYDDSYALLTGFGPDHAVQGVVAIAPGIDCSCSHEVELLLRMDDTATSVRGYEVLLSCDGMVQIVRWNGAMGDFTPIGDGSAPIANGGKFSASVEGSSIVAKWNNAVVAQATDSTFADGQPGIGMFWRGCGEADDFAFTGYGAMTMQP